MLNNLKKALERKNITLKAYASIIGVTEKTLRNKIDEVTAFTYPEVRKTKFEVLPEYDIDYLFASTRLPDEKGA